MACTIVSAHVSSIMYSPVKSSYTYWSLLVMLRIQIANCLLLEASVHLSHMMELKHDLWIAHEISHSTDNAITFKSSFWTTWDTYLFAFFRAPQQNAGHLWHAFFISCIMIATTSNETRLLQWGCWDEIPMKRTHWLLAEKAQNNLTSSWQSALKVNPVENTIPLGKPMKSISSRQNQKKIFLALYTFDIYGWKLPLQDTPKVLNKRKRSGLNSDTVKS